VAAMISKKNTAGSMFSTNLANSKCIHIKIRQRICVHKIMTFNSHLLQLSEKVKGSGFLRQSVEISE